MSDKTPISEQGNAEIERKADEFTRDELALELERVVDRLIDIDRLGDHGTEQRDYYQRRETILNKLLD